MSQGPADCMAEKTSSYRRTGFVITRYYETFVQGIDHVAIDIADHGNQKPKLRVQYFPTSVPPAVADRRASRSNTSHSWQGMRILEALLPLNLFTGTISVLFLSKLGFNQRASVELLPRNIPVDRRRDEDRNQEHARIVHVLRRGGAHSGQDEDDADEESPQASPGVDEFARFAHMPWAGDELAEE